MKLLLAEDERDLSNAVSRVLRLYKYDVDQAFDGQQALDMLSDTSYDLLILDVMMPKKNGFEVLKEIRDGKSNIPVLVLTAKSELDDKLEGFDAGADDYLTKPFQIKELLARIKALARRKGEIITEKCSIGNISLDHENFELVGKKRVRLTNKEFKLMEYLIQNQNQISSSESIMENVWEFDTEAEINVVWVFISSLRKKLEEVGSDVSIKAVRGLGYRLEK